MRPTGSLPDASLIRVVAGPPPLDGMPFLERFVGQLDGWVLVFRGHAPMPGTLEDAADETALRWLRSRWCDNASNLPGWTLLKLQTGDVESHLFRVGEWCWPHINVGGLPTAERHRPIRLFGTERSCVVHTTSFYGPKADITLGQMGDLPRITIPASE